jgi:DNA-binding MarR family transcriptional regulator
MILRLTPAGNAEFAQQAAAHEAWINDILHGISAADARLMAAQLIAVAQAAENKEKIDDPSHA